MHPSSATSDHVGVKPASKQRLTTRDYPARICAGFPCSVMRAYTDTFSLAEHHAFCEREADSIASARRRMEHARSEEFARWAASGELSA